MPYEARYFTEEEIAGLDPELIAMLDRARHKAGIPFIITSGRRSIESNDAAGGVSDSAHVSGRAVDLRCHNSEGCFKIIDALLDEGATRIVIGIKPSGKNTDEFYHNIHVDNDPTKPSPVLSVKLYA